MGSAQHVVGKSIQSSFNAAQMQGSQNSNIRFTHYLHSSFYSILLKEVFYYTICCWAFLTDMQKKPCTVSAPLTPGPDGAEQMAWHRQL